VGEQREEEEEIEIKESGDFWGKKEKKKKRVSNLGNLPQ